MNSSNQSAAAGCGTMTIKVISQTTREREEETHQQLTSVEGIGDKLADRIIDTLNNDTYES